MEEKLALYAEPVGDVPTVTMEYQNPYEPAEVAGSWEGSVITVSVIGVALVSVYLVYRLVRKEYWVSAAVFLCTGTLLAMIAANLIGVRSHPAFAFLVYNLGPILMTVSLLAFAFGIHRLERTVRRIEQSFTTRDDVVSGTEAVE